MLKKLVPLADRVLVKRLVPVSKTAAGIYIPDNNLKGNQGEVLAVGPGFTTREGKQIPVPLSVGDKVLLPEFGGVQVKLDNEEGVLFRSDEILAKVAN